MTNDLRLLIHCKPQLACPEFFDSVEQADPAASIKRDWDGAIAHLWGGGMSLIDVVIDILGRDGMVGLEHQQELWQLRVTHNYSAIPLYFALSCVDQPAALRYEIRRLGGHYLNISDVSRQFGPQLEELRLELQDVKRAAPKWEIIEEYSGADPRRAHVVLKFGGRPTHVGGSDRQRAVLAVLLKNNGIPRSLKALRQLCSEDPLFTPSGGSLAVPQVGTLKVYVFRDIPKHLQKAFDRSRSGYRADRIIEHVDLGAKAFGFRIRGTSKVTVR